ncbi:MAG: ABC transporter permease [Pseudomonadota bacterium]
MNRALFRMVWRNLSGNLRRTLLTVSAVAIGLAAMIFLWGFSDGLQSNMAQNFQETLVGSLEIQHQGFFRHPELQRHIQHPDELITALEDSGVGHWTQRLFTFALAAGENTSLGLMLLGIDPSTEPRVTHIAEKITEGRFFTDQQAHECVLGATTARNLGARIGDPIVLMSYDRYGTPAVEEFTLTGIITSGELGIDRGLVLAPLATVQEMLEMQGRITGITVRLADKELAKTAKALQELLAGREYDVLRWDEMFPAVKEWMSLSDAFHYIFLTVVLLIVLAGVVNTVLLSMLERTRELGVMMALGTKRYQIGALVALESLVIGLLGIATGTLLGITTVLLVGRVGIDLSLLMGSTTRFYVDPIIHTRLDIHHLWYSCLAALVTTLLAGIYPALKAAQLEPVEAIRHG